MPDEATTIVLAPDGVLAGSTILPSGWVRVHGGVIVEVGAGDAPEGAQRYAGILVPGFVDVHTHGALGHDFGSADTEGIRAAIAHHVRRGTTTLVASVATAPLDVLAERVATLGALVRNGEIAGIHLEGPYLSAGHRGAHAMDLLRTPDVDEIRRLLEIAPGTVRMVTIAPELPGARDVIRFLVSEGVTVAIGHTSCTARRAQVAFDWGATMVTHAYNGMPSLHHREAGPLGAAIVDDRVTVELILDGHHVGREAVEVIRRAAGTRLALVSDAMAATGLGDGEYSIAGSPVVVRDGVAMLSDGSSLAGSTITLADGLGRLLMEHGASLTQAVAAATTTPAAALRLPEPFIRRGSPADLVLLRGAVLSGVMRGGRWVSPPGGSQAAGAT